MDHTGRNYTALIAFEGLVDKENLSSQDKLIFERTPEIYVIRRLLYALQRATDHGYLSKHDINIKALSIGDKNLIVSPSAPDDKPNDQEPSFHENSDILEPNDSDENNNLYTDDSDTTLHDVIEDALSPPFPFEDNQTLETQEEEIPSLPPRQGSPAVTSRASQAALQSELTDYYTTDHLM